MGGLAPEHLYLKLGFIHAWWKQKDEEEEEKKKEKKKLIS